IRRLVAILLGRSLRCLGRGDDPSLDSSAEGILGRVHVELATAPEDLIARLNVAPVPDPDLKRAYALKHVPDQRLAAVDVADLGSDRDQRLPALIDAALAVLDVDAPLDLDPIAQISRLHQAIPGTR